MKEIELSQGYVAFIDDVAFEEISRYKWHVLDSHPIIRYASRWEYSPKRSIRMHHSVLNIHPKWLRDNNLVVDHIDRNGLNNQKANLRIATRSINALNSARSDNATGVYWDSHRGRFKSVDIQTKKFLGWYKTKEEALADKGLL